MSAISHSRELTNGHSPAESPGGRLVLVVLSIITIVSVLLFQSHQSPRSPERTSLRLESRGADLAFSGRF